jgi:Ornithine decarboxylase antizyme
VISVIHTYSYLNSNGSAAVGDGAFYTDASVLAVCHVQGHGSEDKYFYSTTFSGGAGVSVSFLASRFNDIELYSGVFDVPRQKCPPYGGSSVCVTGKPAHVPPITTRLGTSDQTHSVPNLFSHSNRIVVPVSTPPLTPDDDNSSGSLSSIGSMDWKATPPEFLMTLFPRAAIRVSPYAKSVSVQGEGATFDGFVLDLPHGFSGINPKAAVTRTLFVDGKGADTVKLRESLVAMLDLADEHLFCKSVIIALEKSTPTLSGLLHSLMYAGGSFVTQPVLEVDPAFVLVGIEI